MNKEVRFCFISYSIIVVSWLLSMVIAMYSLEYGRINHYLVCYLVLAVTCIVGCYMASHWSHMKLVRKDNRECFSSVCYLIVENSSILFGQALTNIDIAYKLILQKSDRDLVAGEVMIFSSFFLVAGLLGLSSRRIFTTPLSIIAICLMVLGGCYIGKITT